jgi:Carboxypeptidase regulatory-like domain
MKKLIASTLVLALAIAAAPINLIAAGKLAQNTGQIAGNAVIEGKPMGNVTVRLRNVDTGQLVGNTTTNAQGAFSFSGLPPGNFVVETVAANGTILGTSATISLVAGAMIAGAVTVSTTAAAAAAAGIGAGAAGAAGGATAGGAAAAGAGLSTTAIVITAAAVTLGAVGIVVATNDSSPSQ